MVISAVAVGMASAPLARVDDFDFVVVGVVIGFFDTSDGEEIFDVLPTVASRYQLIVFVNFKDPGGLL